MKKVKLLVYALITSFTVLSCTDAVDIVQDGELTEAAALQNTQDLRGFLNGNVYGAFDTANEIWLSSVFTDETGIAPSNSGWYFAEFRYILTSDNGYVGGTWGNHYRLINRVNRLMKAAEGITPAPGAETSNYNSILAEARAMRALAYLQLQSYFTTDMTDDNALGVILINHVPDLNEQLPRVSNGQIYAQIEADLAFADANLLAGGTYKFVTKTLINSIRARMYTYRGDYVKAKQYAQAAMATAPALTPASNDTASNPYRTMWTDTTQGEIIFAASRPSNGTFTNMAGFYTTNATNMAGSPFLKMGMNLYSIIGNAYDIRGKVFVDPSSYSNPTVKIIDKYPGKGNTPLRNDVKVFRTVELYFIMAEVAVAENDLAGAANLIRTVRSSRRVTNVTIPLPVYATKADALKDILKERRGELCFEGHRYVDLRRLGEAAGVSIDRSPLDDGGVGLGAPLTLPITDHRWTFPIPSGERAGNPAIVQNVGY